MKFEPNRELGDFLKTKSRNYETNGKILNEELTIVVYEEIITRLQRKSQNVNRVRIGRETSTRIISRAENGSEGLENPWQEWGLERTGVRGE